MRRSTPPTTLSRDTVSKARSRRVSTLASVPTAANSSASPRQAHSTSTKPTAMTSLSFTRTARRTSA
ncbi:hypothetical protein BC830DRAFT_1150008 [Chytriomyces sp. MP71]|nr:hypothetical protein BC830DRAFT_1150008 [Chytriomyces sp. MP71]